MSSSSSSFLASKVFRLALAMLVRMTVIKTKKGPKLAEPSKCHFEILMLDGEFIDLKQTSFTGVDLFNVTT